MNRFVLPVSRCLMSVFLAATTINAACHLTLSGQLVSVP
jgi:hypothetical protein